MFDLFKKQKEDGNSNLVFYFFISLIILLFEIKTALSYCFIFGLSISLIVLICMYPRFLNGAERKMRSLRYTSPKYLFDLVIPNFYIM